ncbi:MAG: CYTH domain-containing protein [Clostridia bacterium]
MKDKTKNIFIVLETIIIIILSIMLILKYNENNILEYDSEIERKWLIKTEDIPYDLSKAEKYEIEQTYLNFSPEIRVRNINNNEYILTTKCDSSIKGLEREEHEYLITKEEYNNLLTKKEGNTIYKTRYRFIDENDIEMEIDIFSGELEGLAYLEIEFVDIKSAENYQNPNWVIKDVTTDLLYKNGYLARYGIPDSFLEYIK